MVLEFRAEGERGGEEVEVEMVDLCAGLAGSVEGRGRRTEKKGGMWKPSLGRELVKEREGGRDVPLLGGGDAGGF